MADPIPHRSDVPSDTDQLVAPSEGEGTRAKLTDALLQSALIASSGEGLSSVLDVILDQLARVVNYDSASIVLKSRLDSRIIACRGLPAECPVRELVFPNGSGKFAEMEDTKQPLIIDDVWTDERWISVPGTEHVRSWIGAPLLARGEMIGSLNIDKADPGYYTAEDARLVMAFANQAAVVIENARLLEEERQRAAQLRLIGDISQRVLSILDPEALLDYAVQAIQSQFNYYYVDIFLVDPTGEYVVFQTSSHTGYKSRWRDQGLRFRIGEKSITGHVADTGRSYLANDVLHDPWYATDDLLLDTHSELAVPIRAGERVLGVLDLNSDRLNAFDERDFFVTQSLADQLALGLENARLFAAEARRRREAETLQAAIQALSATLDLPEVLERILTELQHVVPYDSASVQQIKGDGLEIIGGHGFPNLEQLLGVRFDLVGGDNPNREVVRKREPVIVDDAPATYNGFRRKPHAQAGIRSWLGVPLLFGDRLIGMLALDKREPSFYTQEHARLALAFAAQAGIAIDNARLFMAERQSRLESKSIQSTVIALSAELHLDTLLERIVGEAAQAFHAEATSLMLWDKEATSLVVAAGCGLSDEYAQQQRISREMVQATLPSSGVPQPIYVPDLAEAPFGDRALIAKEGIKSVLSIALMAQGHPSGVLNIYSKGYVRAFSRDEIDLAEAFAAQAANAIKNASIYQQVEQYAQENARLLEAAERRVAELEAVRQATLGLTSSLRLQEVLGTILSSTVALLMEVQDAHIFLYQQDRLAFGAALWADGSQDRPWSEPRPAGLTYTVARQGQPIVVPDIQAHPLFVGAPDDWAGAIVGLPLKIGQRVVGVMNVSYQQPRAVAEAELRVLQLLADQAAVAIENARLYQAEYEQRTLAEALHQATTAINSTLDLDQVLDRILEQMYNVIPSDAANIMLIDGEYVHTVRWRGYDRFGVEEGISSLILRTADTPTYRYMQETGNPLLIRDTAIYPGWVSLPETTWLRSYAGAPICVKGQIIGFLSVDSTTTGFFDQADADRLQAFAAQAAAAIENAHLYRGLSRHLEEMLLLNKVALAATSTLDLDEVIRRSLEALLDIPHFERANVLLVDQSAGDLWLHPALISSGRLPQRANLRIPLGRGIAGHVAQTAKPWRVGDVRQEPLYIAGYPDTLSEVAVPLRVSDQIIGVLDAQSTHLNAFSEEDERLLVTLAGQLSTIVDNARLFKEAQQRVRELTALSQVSQALNEARDLGTMLNIVLEKTFDFMNSQEGSILLIQPPGGDVLRMVAERGLGREVMDEFNSRPVHTHEGTYRRALASGHIVEVADTTADPDFLRDVGSRARSVTNVPLVVERRPIGLIAFDGLPKDDTARRLLMALSDMAAVAIDKERLHQETADRLAEVSTLYTLSTQITGSLSLSRVMEAIVTILKVTINCRACCIFLLDPTIEALPLEASSGLPQESRSRARLRADQGIGHAALRERGPVYVPDIQLTPDLAYFDPEVHSVLAVPLVVRNQAIGVLSLDDTRPDAFGNEMRLLTIAAAQAAVAIENAQLYESLQTSYRDLEQAYDALRELDQMKSELVQNISHELRTPLTFIRGYVELLQDGDMGEMNDEQNAALDIVAAKSNILSRLVDDIITLQYANKERIKLAVVSLADLGRAALQAASPNAAELQITLRDEIPGELPPVFGDEQRLMQVFDNLLSNAFKFSRAGGAITVRMRAEAAFVRVEVEDEGIGIPADKLPYIFDRFYQVDGSTTRRFGGTGLGLAIVKQIVESHGGQAGARSEQKKGSCFYFTIPQAEMTNEEVKHSHADQDI
jgi:GAF domain-containing protein